MKKLMMICALLFSVITYASAQQGGGRMGGTPEERAKRSTDQLVEKLKLTEDQKTKVMAIYTAQNAEMTKAREAAGDDMSGMREKMTKMNAETNTKIEAVLTDEQKPAFKTMLEERKKAMEARMNGGGQ
ncbi:hypothetical protein [Pedobacter jejuensis]|uniref:Periplasmic heavy metal sensor n=1 Tax=Pedobacter jejuensis TaxID=1268550 RepID=A0A3N0BX39_9SPHI|nr:hypothetical protein [Pedobacter jejuensis]RNL54030.1 hypothetical protein D7004_07990 [Pedobacter jejuensis]